MICKPRRMISWLRSPLMLAMNADSAGIVLELRVVEALGLGNMLGVLLKVLYFSMLSNRLYLSHYHLRSPESAPRGTPPERSRRPYTNSSTGDKRAGRRTGPAEAGCAPGATLA